jgi:hypothetical protein
MDMASIHTKNMDFLYNTMKEYEGINPNILETLYDYHVEDHENFEIDAIKIREQFRSGDTDPSKMVSKQEASFKRIKRKKTSIGMSV